jgi:SAM-dependent methyltransferase
MVKQWLAHPLLRGLDVDDPRTTTVRRQIIQRNRFLRQIYVEWYASLEASLPTGGGQALELGSGAGFLSDTVPNLITSEIFWCEHIQVVVDGRHLPIAAGTLRAILMTDVLHHVPDVHNFFAEAARCVQPGGIVAMVEPWVTRWSSIIYTRLHHEPFRPQTPDWDFPAHGPLSSANGALPWIVFERDRAQFEREFPQWRVEMLKPIMPFRYLVSGGVSLRPLMPGWSFGAWRALENLFAPWMKMWAMFALIVLRREDGWGNKAQSAR